MADRVVDEFGYRCLRCGAKDSSAPCWKLGDPTVKAHLRDGDKQPWKTIELPAYRYPNVPRLIVVEDRHFIFADYVGDYGDLSYHEAVPYVVPPTLAKPLERDGQVFSDG